MTEAAQETVLGATHLSYFSISTESGEDAWLRGKAQTLPRFGRCSLISFGRQA